MINNYKIEKQPIINVRNTQYEIVKEISTQTFKFKLSYQQDLNFDLLWTDSEQPLELYQKLKSYQKINFIPGIVQICKKNLLNQNIKIMQQKFQHLYYFYPQTWNLPQEIRLFKKYMEDNHKKYYIIKPDSSCQGKGIYMISKYDDLQIQEYSQIAQEYIHNPYLIDGLKWDLRLYVLIAGTDPLRIFLYKEGIARFATINYEKPNKDNKQNQFLHLTNYAINKNNPFFQYNENENNADAGHKRSYTSILQYFKSQNIQTDVLEYEIYQIIFRTISCIYLPIKKDIQKLYPLNYANDNCFQLLGFDIIIDQNLKPWLLEVNQNPSLIIDTPFDQKIKSNLITDVMQLMNVKNQKNRQIYEQIQQDRSIFDKLYCKKSNQNNLTNTHQDVQAQRNEWIYDNIGNFIDIMQFQQLDILKQFEQYQNGLYNKNFIHKLHNQKINKFNKIYCIDEKDKKSVLQKNIKGTKSLPKFESIFKQSKSQQDLIHKKPRILQTCQIRSSKINFVKKLDLQIFQDQTPAFQFQLRNQQNYIKEQQQQSQFLNLSKSNYFIKQNQNYVPKQQIKNNRQQFKINTTSSLNDYMKNIQKSQNIQQMFSNICENQENTKFNIYQKYE